MSCLSANCTVAIRNPFQTARRLLSECLQRVPNSLLKCCWQLVQVELQKANRFFLV